MLDVLADNPLLTLVVVIAVGSLAGQVRIAGVSLGVAAVLFAGMGASALDARLELPEIVYLLGLALFVYSVGIEAGESIKATFGRRGLQLNAFALLVVVIGAVEVVALAHLLDLGGAVAAGTYTGALTNTPALAGVLDALSRTEQGVSAAPVVGYSLAYPIGVLGLIIPIALLQRRWRVDHEAEAVAAGIGRPIAVAVVRVTRTDRPEVRALGPSTGTDVEVSRVESAGRAAVARATDRLDANDVVTLLGDEAELRRATEWLGVPVARAPRRAELDHRGMFVSNPAVVGCTLRQLALRRRYGIVVTRIRRGDVDLLAHSGSVLQLGDRVRVVAPEERMHEAERLFGDSYRTVSEIDVLTFAVGLGLGLALGLVPIQLPGGTHIELGTAGGPLVVALALGALGRTGPLVWRPPYAVNLTLRQVGVVLFLAGVGTRAGQAFVDALADPDSLLVLGAGAIVTLSASLTVLVVGHKLLRLPFGQVTGMVAGIHTQPAALAFANEQARNALPDAGYASVYPVAMIAKIVVAQLVLALLL